MSYKQILDGQVKSKTNNSYQIPLEPHLENKFVDNNMNHGNFSSLVNIF